MKHTHLSAFLIFTVHIFAVEPDSNTTPTAPRELRFETVEKLHAYNLHAFEQVRDAFGFSRVLRIYNNPLDQKNLYVGNQPVKSISLVSNTYSKSLNTNTIKLQAQLKGFKVGSSHPANTYSMVSNGQEEKVYGSLSAEKPLLRDGGKVWAVMLAKQQCIKCHPGTKVGNVMGAFVYEVAPQPKDDPEKELDEAVKAVLLEVSMRTEFEWQEKKGKNANPR